MKVYKEMSIYDFEPWSGAVDTYGKIDEAGELDALENLIDELYPDGIDETQLNDLLWFEDEWLLETLGIHDPDEDEEIAGDYDDFCGKFKSCASCPLGKCEDCEKSFAELAKENA